MSLVTSTPTKSAFRRGSGRFSCICFGMDDWGNWRLNFFTNDLHRTGSVAPPERNAATGNGSWRICMSKHYIDNKTKIRWHCAEGHEWHAIPSNILRNHWCKICGNERQGRLKAHTIELMQKIAAERGGECLSKIYKNNLTKLRWRCKHGHEWEAVPGSITQETKQGITQNLPCVMQRTF